MEKGARSAEDLSLLTEEKLEEEEVDDWPQTPKKKGNEGQASAPEVLYFRFDLQFLCQFENRF